MALDFQSSTQIYLHYACVVQNWCHTLDDAWVHNYANNLRRSSNLAIIQSWCVLEKICSKGLHLYVYGCHSHLLYALWQNWRRSRGTAGNVQRSVPEAFPYLTRGSLPPHRLLSKRRSGGLHLNAIPSPATLADWQKQHFCSIWTGVLNTCTCKKCDYIIDLKILLRTQIIKNQKSFSAFMHFY